MKQKKLTSFFLISLVLVGLVGNLTFTIAQDDDEEDKPKSLSWTVNQASGEMNALLQKDMLKNAIGTDGNPFEGLGVDDSGIFDTGSGSNIYTFENLVAIAALATRSTLSDNGEAQTLAISDSWGAIKTHTQNQGSGSKVFGFVVKDKDLSAEEQLPKLTYLQGAAMEFLSTAYRQSQYGEIATKVNSLYAEMKAYQSNDTVGYNGDSRGFWTAVLGKTADGGLKYIEPNDPDYIYLQASVNFWVIAGIANAYRSLGGTGNALGDEAIETAESAMAFVDSVCWDTSMGLYREYRGKADEFKLETQALALLACARLFIITKKITYINRAEVLLSSIDRYFLISGLGGAVDKYNVLTSFTERQQSEAVLSGWSNSLLAYACMELYEARQKSVFSDVAKNIINFMWNRLLYVVEGSALGGLVEYTQNTPEKAAYNQIAGREYRRYTKTNALALYVNEKIAYYTRSFFEIYMWWIIGGIGVAVIIVIVSILVSRRRRIGTKLPKVVKGLIGD